MKFLIEKSIFVYAQMASNETPQIDASSPLHLVEQIRNILMQLVGAFAGRDSLTIHHLTFVKLLQLHVAIIIRYLLTELVNVNQDS